MWLQQAASPRRMTKKNSTRTSMRSLVADLREVTDRIHTTDPDDDVKAIKKLRLEIESLTRRLEVTAAKLDPVLRPSSIFDPTAPSTAGRIVALTLVAQARHPLAAIPEFYGAGVYAIYYKGDFDTYGPLSGTDHPIYVGKADPMDAGAKDAIAQGAKLSARLAEHAKSIRKAATTLNIDDFECRFLIVQTGFQKSAEEYLINFFKPIWNSETKICFGLGKHGDSSETRVNKRSPWDTLHPGRAWADATTENQKSPELISEQIRAHFVKNTPHKDIHEIFDHFMGEMRQLNTERFCSPMAACFSLDESGNQGITNNKDGSGPDLLSFI